MSAPPALAPLTGALVGGRYRLGTVIGRGAMSDVYRATDERVGRTVAVKVLRTDCTDPVRFAEETELLRHLDHPHLVRLLDTGTHDGAPYLVLNLLHETLADRLHHGPIDPAQAARIGGEVAAALAYLHANGIVHRDVKPSNLLLRADGTACLADLGAALSVDGPRHTMTGLTIGTPMYLAPEQATGDPVTGATDVYALGLVLLEATTGRAPFDGTQSERIVARVTRPPAVPANLPAGLRRALAPMVAVDAAARPDAASVAAELVRLSVSSPSEASDVEQATAPIPLAVPAPDDGLGAPGAPTEIAPLPLAEPSRGRWLAAAAALIAIALIAVAWRGGADAPAGAGDDPAITTSTTVAVPTTTTPAPPSTAAVATVPPTATAGTPTDPGAKPEPCGPGCNNGNAGGNGNGKGNGKAKP